MRSFALTCCLLSSLFAANAVAQAPGAAPTQRIRGDVTAL